MKSIIHSVTILSYTCMFVYGGTLLWIKIKPVHLLLKLERKKDGPKVSLLVETLQSSCEGIIKTIAICLFILGGLIFLCSLIFNLYPTSYFSLIIISAALCLIFRKRLIIAVSAILIGILFYVDLCEIRDYNHVLKYNSPPVYNILSVSSCWPNRGGNYKYSKLFYDAYGTILIQKINILKLFQIALMWYSIRD